jgi:hypothetical protein
MFQLFLFSHHSLIEQLETENAKKRKKIEMLSVNVTHKGNPQSLKKVVEHFNQMRKAWMERKALCMNAVDILCEATNKKRNTFMVSRSDFTSIFILSLLLL